MKLTNMLIILACFYLFISFKDFPAILGRGPRAFLIGKISDIHFRIWEIFKALKVDDFFPI